MRQKHFLLTALCASILSLTGCSGLGTNTYNNEKSIASNVNSYNLNNVTQTSDGGTFSAQVDNMEGMDTIWNYDAATETSTELSYDITLYSGKLKLTLISPNQEVTTLVELDSENNTTNSASAAQGISSEGNSAVPAQDAPDDNFAVSEVDTVSLTLNPGENRIKVVTGEDTRFDINLSVSEGEFGELGF